MKRCQAGTADRPEPSDEMLHRFSNECSHDKSLHDSLIDIVKMPIIHDQKALCKEKTPRRGQTLRVRLWARVADGRDDKEDAA